MLGDIVRVEDAVGAGPKILEEPPLVAADFLRLAQRLQLVLPCPSQPPTHAPSVRPSTGRYDGSGYT